MPKLPEKLQDEITLTDSESVIGTVRFFWTVWLGPLLLGGLLILFGIFLVAAAPPVAILMFLVGTVIVGLVARAKRSSGAVVTTERVIVSRGGLLGHETKEVRMSDIKSISSTQGGLESLRGNGSVTVRTGAGDISLPVSNHRELAETLREQQNAAS